MGKEDKKLTVITYSSMFLEGGLNTVLTALMAVLAVQFARDVGDIALLVSVKSVGTFLTLYVSGRFSDVYGRKKLILLGSILFSTFLIIMIKTTNYYVALIASFIAGLAHGCMDSPSISLLFDVYGNESSHMMSLIQVFFGGGGAITSFLASSFISKGISYQYIFLFYLVVSILIFILIINTKFPKANLEKEISNDNKTQFKVKPTMKKEGLLLIIIIFVFTMISFILFTWLPTFVEISKGFSVSESVLALTYYMVGSIIGAFLFSLILKKVKTTTVLKINPVLASIGFLGLLLLDNLFMLYISSFIIGFFLGNFFSLIIDMGGKMFSDRSGMITGAIGSSSMVGGTLIIVFTSRMINVIGIDWIMKLSLIFLIIVIVLTYVLDRMVKKIII